MSTNSINSLSSAYLQPVFNALQTTGSTNTGNSSSSIGAVSGIQQPDSSQLSPFGQLMSMLQQLQQSNPTKYQQVTQQIATNLQGAAQAAQSQGNTAAANQLNQLATDFTNASKSGQMPNVQDLAQALSGHHHHHHAHASTDSDGDSGAAGNSPSAGSSSSLSQLLSAFQTNGTQADATNPMNIIMNTLSNAGISGS